MKCLSESDLKRQEPEFLWKSPLLYRITENKPSAILDFSKLSQAAVLSFVCLFVCLIIAGVVELWYNFPVYAAIIPLLVTIMGFALQRNGRRQRFKECWMQISPGACLVVNGEKRWEIQPLIAVLVQNRWVHRDGSFVIRGNSELYLVTKCEGNELFFPLGRSGVLRDLDSLGADISRLAGCTFNKQLIMK